MAKLQWNVAGEHFYEAGADRGVLYLEDGSGVPWNGLIGVTERVTGNELSPIYFDGVKIFDSMSPGEFAGTLRAYTYPDEFLPYEGVEEVGNGLHITGQRPKRFGLSYRTKIGNDETEDVGYKIHILYNLLAIPSPKQFASLNPNINPIEFEWSVSAIPSTASGYRPTAHLIFDTRTMSDLLIEDIENSLYGNALDDARLPDFASLVGFISQWVILRITDNGDGTWTATGPDSMITMLSATSFQITQANATFLDPDTYMISDSTF